MSACKFIASDIPLAEFAPSQKYPLHIDIDSGTIDDSDADDNLKAENVSWVSVRAFLPGVIYIAPVLNKYLYELSETYSKDIIKRQGVTVDYRYMPFSWLPHTTLAKRLSNKQLTNVKRSFYSIVIKK